ncbi:MAG: hypothetical protein H6819_07145 [Phycisphaerales bacterium]|nr:hypothetical protein [Phycisphaerales bacterium]MCB9857730.1 hypothetical protein [Phycisphaerales bacterium]MCB9863790.1 hypothetical protein [Phycisphaerales bacterium]
MTTRDQLYCQMLTLGFVVLRQAVESGDSEWVEQEMELLHNVPSLIDESNIERHKYFLEKEKQRYEEWALSPGRDTQKSLMLTYYTPLWKQMEALGEEKVSGEDKVLG